MPETTAELDKAAADIPLTRSARDVLERALSLADKRAALHADPVDVLEALLSTRGTMADQAMRALGVDPAKVTVAASSDGSEGLPLRQLLVNANREAQVLGHYQVDSIHLLLALLYSDSRATAAALMNAGLTMYDLRRHLQTGVPPDAPVAVRQRPPGFRSRPPDASLRRKPLPSLRGVFGVSPIFMGLIAVMVISGAALWFNVLPPGTAILTIVFVVAGWVASVCVHEFGHAFVAYLGGDRSVAASGYLTLDPLRYTNVLLSIVMPVAFLLLGGIGLPGGAVYIDHAALRSKLWDSAVSVAGPVGTLLFGLVVAAPFLFPSHLQWITPTNFGFFVALGFLAFMEVLALCLNLLPIPGLDGFGIIRPWLPYSAQATANRFGQFGILIVFFVLWYVAPVRDAFFLSIYQIANGIGIDQVLIYYGQLHMRLQ